MAAALWLQPRITTSEVLSTTNSRSLVTRARLKVATSRIGNEIRERSGVTPGPMRPRSRSTFLSSPE